MFTICRKSDNKRLCSFYDNDLPITRKTRFNKDTERIEHVFTTKNIFIFDNTCYNIYSNQVEATAHIDYMHRAIEENRKRYESVLQGSTEALHEFIRSKLLIVIDKEES